MSERSIMAALARGEDPDLIVNREALRYAVQRAITCPQSGRVLDISRAVLVEIAGRGSGVYDAEMWDSVEATVREHVAKEGYTMTVHDGRVLFGKGK